MSRFVDILNQHGRVVHVENIPAIIDTMLERLDAENAHLEFHFPYFIEKKAPVTQSPGMMDYEASFIANSQKKGIDFILGVTVPVTTLCPCSKAISARGAHNQRGVVKALVRFTETIWIEELISMIEASASCELYSLLKRQDEKYVTERAYDNPVFVEDLVRNVAVRLREEPRISWYRVEAENFESIHNHNAFAVVEGKNAGSSKRQKSRRKN